MVGKWSVSDDKLTYTFELRDGLRFSDNTPVTTADVIPSIRRWMVRSGSGQLLAARMADLSALDERTFRVRLKVPFSLMLEMFSGVSMPILFIMRKREAETDPMQKIDRVVGSGPFILNEAETKVGTQYVYDKNPNYPPRSEPANGMAGGKVVKVDRVVFVNMPDSQTAGRGAAGRGDRLLRTAADRSARAVGGRPEHRAGDPLRVRFGGIRRAELAASAVQQRQVPPGHHAHHQPGGHAAADLREPEMVPAMRQLLHLRLADGQRRQHRLVQERPEHPAGQTAPAGKAATMGGPSSCCRPTNFAYMANAATVLAQQLRAAGIKVDLHPMDWANVVQRRSVQAPPEQGGWNIFFTSTGGLNNGNPYMLSHLATIGTKGWFGWADDAKNEQLRADWLAADTLEQRKAIAAQIQDNAWNIVPHLYFGQWTQPTAHRRNVTGWLHEPELLTFWNVEKV